VSARVFDIDDKLPSLNIPWPQCSRCGEGVQIEDGMAWCDGCLIEWPSIDEDAVATPLEEHEERCGAESATPKSRAHDARGRHYEPGPYRPCILPSGHKGDHLHPYTVTVTEVTA